jgi:hypothetical protein
MKIIKNILIFFYSVWWVLGNAAMADPHYVLESKNKEHWRPLVINIAKIKLFFKRKAQGK